MAAAWPATSVERKVLRLASEVSEREEGQAVPDDLSLHETSKEPDNAEIGPGELSRVQSSVGCRGRATPTDDYR